MMHAKMTVIKMVPDIEKPGAQKITLKINEAVVDVVVSDVDGCRLGVYCCPQQMSALCPVMMPSFLKLAE